MISYTISSKPTSTIWYVKIYDIVGQGTVLANCIYDVRNNVVCDTIGQTYEVVYDIFKTYDIVGQGTGPANRMYDVDLTLRIKEMLCNQPSLWMNIKVDNGHSMRCLIPCTTLPSSMIAMNLQLIIFVGYSDVLNQSVVAGLCSFWRSLLQNQSNSGQNHAVPGLLNLNSWVPLRLRTVPSIFVDAIAFGYRESFTSHASYK